MLMSFLGRPWLRDLGSTLTLFTFLWPWLGRFTQGVSLLGDFKTASNVHGNKSKVVQKTWKMSPLLSEFRFVEKIALPLLFHDRRIKVHKSLNQSINEWRCNVVAHKMLQEFEALKKLFTEVIRKLQILKHFSSIIFWAMFKFFY